MKVVIVHLKKKKTHIHNLKVDSVLFSGNYEDFKPGDENAFLSEQCKEIEENNRLGKTRDLFEKIRDTKGTFHKRMGTIKDRNCMDLTEAEDVKKR